MLSKGPNLFYDSRFAIPLAASDIADRALPSLTQAGAHSRSATYHHTPLHRLNQQAAHLAIRTPSASPGPHLVRAMDDVHTPSSSRRDLSEHEHQASSSSSQQHIMDSPPSKKRSSRAGTRSVNTLTPSQLERKRANDREAQRAIRQRTKEHIENLERRIAELSTPSEAGGQNLELLRRNEELEQENALLRSQLTHAMAALNVPDSETMSTTSSGIITPGTRSPVEPHQMLDTPRNQGPPPRSVPLTGIPQASAQSGWPTHSSYAGGLEPRSAHPHPQDVKTEDSANPSAVRWDTAPPPHPQVPPMQDQHIHHATPVGPPPLTTHPSAAPSGYGYHHVPQPAYGQTLPYSQDPAQQLSGAAQQQPTQHMDYRVPPGASATSPTYAHAGGAGMPVSAGGYPHGQYVAHQPPPSGYEGGGGMMYTPR